jgi:hypothetical protein
LTADTRTSVIGRFDRWFGASTHPFTPSSSISFNSIAPFLQKSKRKYRFHSTISPSTPSDLINIVMGDYHLTPLTYLQSAFHFMINTVEPQIRARRWDRAEAGPVEPREMESFSQHHANYGADCGCSTDECCCEVKDDNQSQSEIQDDDESEASSVPGEKAMEFVFVGHSLGGAIASLLAVAYNTSVSSYCLHHCF